MFAKAHYTWSLPDPVRTNPVIVHTVGKVGSTAVAATLEATLPGRYIAHVHWLRSEHLRADEAHYRSRARAYWGTRRMSRFMPQYIWLGQHLCSAMASAPANTVWDVVTLVRDPVRRNISAFFQNLEPMFDFWPAEELKIRSAEEVAARLVELFLDSYVAGKSPIERDGDPLTWFDLELKPVFGVDVFARPFPVSQGYEIYSGPNSRVLLVRLEDLDRVAAVAFAEFLGVDVSHVVSRNEAADKVYADVYQRFRQLLRIPAEYLDRLYSSQYATHFYTARELARFRSYWQQEGRTLPPTSPPSEDAPSSPSPLAGSGDESAHAVDILGSK
jgi:hypothetical protein